VLNYIAFPTEVRVTLPPQWMDETGDSGFFGYNKRKYHAKITSLILQRNI
jgi:hypothetical protein